MLSGARVIAEVTYPADARSLPRIRAAVLDALDAQGVDRDDTSWNDFQVAVSEAVTNSIRHARTDAIRVTLSRRDDEFTATILDHGVGFTPHAERSEMPDPTEHGGRGIPLMRALVDRCDVRSDDHGTCVELSTRLRVRS